MKVLKEVLRKNRTALILFCVFSLVSLSVFLLYDIPMEAFWYSFALATFFLLVFFILDFIKESKRSKERLYAMQTVLTDSDNLSAPHSECEADYQKMISILTLRMEHLINDYSEKTQNMIDYYTSWVHQIKTPIAVMKLKLSKDTEEHRELSKEVFRIEQYVDMVLSYIRLESESNDLVISEYSLDDIIKDSVRKFAPSFVEKKIKLEYTDVGKVIITDKKWFSCILDQFISNALKYTKEGSISIFEKDDKLYITDTGIGIAKEDLPRIFEKGYTGNNGRIGEKSSGLGLYLAKKAADMLGVGLSVESTQNKGTSFSIDIKQNN